MALLGAMCSTKKDDVLDHVNQMNNRGETPIWQTTPKRQSELFAQYHQTGDIDDFCEKYPTDTHKIDITKKVLHTTRCSKISTTNIIVDARIINAKTTGLALCECCK
jgi:hypothetical protein